MNDLRHMGKKDISFQYRSGVTGKQGFQKHYRDLNDSKFFYAGISTQNQKLETSSQLDLGMSRVKFPKRESL